LCQVEWFHKVNLQLPEAASRILSAFLLQPLRQGVTPQGTPVLTLTSSVQNWRAITQMSRQGVLNGLHALDRIGLMTTHPSRNVRDPSTYQVPIFLPPHVLEGFKKSSGLRSRPQNHISGLLRGRPPNNPRVVVVVDRSRTMPLSTTTNTEEGTGETSGLPSRPQNQTSSPQSRPLIDALDFLGLASAADLIDRYGEDQINGAILYMVSRPKDVYTNPSGFLIRLLESGTNYTSHILLSRPHPTWDKAIQSLARSAKVEQHHFCTNLPGSKIPCRSYARGKCEIPDNCAIYRLTKPQLSEQRR